MKEQDKVEEFSNGRVGMMIDSLSHIDSIRESNPDLKFSISPIPAEDGYTGKRGIPYASWGIGVSDTSEHKAEAFKLVSFLMSEQTSTPSCRPWRTRSPATPRPRPDFSDSDPLYKEAFDIYQTGYPANEFVGLPIARTADARLRRAVPEGADGDQTSTRRCRSPRRSGRRVLAARPVHPPIAAARRRPQARPPRPGRPRQEKEFAVASTEHRARPVARRAATARRGPPDAAHATPYGFLSPTVACCSS